MKSTSKTIIIVGGSFGGIKAAWDLRKRLDQHHKIILISNKRHTIFRASFPRVIFEGVDPKELTLNLKKNFLGTGILFVEATLESIEQVKDRLTTDKGNFTFDYLILATGTRHAYEELPGSKEYTVPICDAERILDSREKILGFTKGIVYAGVGGHYTPCDGPPMEILMDLDHRLRTLGVRRDAELHYITDKENLLPPGGPQIWTYLENLFRKKDIRFHLNTELRRIEKDLLHFTDGSRKRYDLCILIPPYRGIKAFQRSGLTDERGFVPIDLNTMRADNSKHRNIYAVGDCVGAAGPKQGHLALMQAQIAAAHIAWRIRKGGAVPAYLPEFKCVMDNGGGTATYLYSQFMSDGDVVIIEHGRAPYLSKIKFEKLFFDKKGNIGNLHHKMMK